jgi:hypothetical protein
MKYKIICLLAILFSFSMVATPNRRTCNGMQCAKKQKACEATRGAPGTAKPVIMMIDEIDLLPIHQYLNNF